MSVLLLTILRNDALTEVEFGSYRYIGSQYGYEGTATGFANRRIIIISRVLANDGRYGYQP